MPRNLVLGLGRVRAAKSLFSVFLSRTEEAPLTVTVAPMYNLSFLGTLLVLLQTDHTTLDATNKKSKACLIDPLNFDYSLPGTFCFLRCNISLKWL